LFQYYKYILSEAYLHTSQYNVLSYKVNKTQNDTHQHQVHTENLEAFSLHM